MEKQAGDILNIDISKKAFADYYALFLPSEMREDILTYYNAVIECRDGVAEGAVDTELIEMIASRAPGEEAEEPYLFYVPKDEQTFTIQYDGDERAEAELISNEADLIISADGHSDISITPNNGDFMAEVVPADTSEEIIIQYSTEEISISVTGTTEQKAVISTNESDGSAEIRGLRKSTVIITKDDETTTEEYTYGICTISANGLVVEKAELLGDVNGDNTVDAKDLTVLARHVAKIELITDAMLLQNADVTGEGQVTAADLTKLARYVAKIISTLN